MKTPFINLMDHIVTYDHTGISVDIGVKLVPLYHHQKLAKIIMFPIYVTEKKAGK